MIRQLLLAAFALVSWAGVQAQTTTFPIDQATQKITYTEVVTMDGVSKDELFKRAKQLGILGDKTVRENAEEGTYSYKGEFKVTYPAPQTGMNHSGVVTFTATIYCKDGKYKYVLTDYVHTSPKGNGGKLEATLPECGKYVLTAGGWASIKKQTMEQTDQFINNLKYKMANPNGTGSAPADKSDW